MFERAAAFLDLEDFVSALNAFAEFTAAYPDDCDGLLNLARIALHMEVPELALQAFQKRAELGNDAENVLGAAEACRCWGMSKASACCGACSPTIRRCVLTC